MRRHLVLWLFLSCLLASAQKVVRKATSLPPGHWLQIDARQCHEVRLETAPGMQLVAEARMEGEYRGHFLLQLGEEGSTTRIIAGVQPLFELPDDKLGAHKVVAIALQIRLPEYRRVLLHASSAQIRVTGDYEKLEIFQEEGQCTLIEVAQRADIVTREADIYLESTAADVAAQSRYGRVISQQIPPGSPRFRLQTISGDIHLIRRE